ncbi:phosphoesterase [Aliidongia dinghuensis]|uniref:Phosphoesterase n=1 Tax=Aliidongia dinghuensis TaxID=1867774 RepID=A0A8J3E4H7_9PROT|nr:alkaline phosphatase family protein [Aliidongia dinghuensis]GGF14522.1 phosphoesterase [Aliidongia dinghuensis]
MPQIDHFVVLMLENRAFDHLFGFRPEVQGLTGKEFNLLNPAEAQSLANPPFTVGTGAPFAITVGQGPGHSVKQTNMQLFGNNAATGPVANDGFVKSYQVELTVADHVPHPSNADLGVVMQSFSAAQLPVLNALADEFAVCDQWYAEVPGPTQPNRLYLHAATSAGHALNAWSAHFDLKTIYQQLQEAGRTWATYEHDTNEVRSFTPLQGYTAAFKQIDAFAADCASGKLPNYSFIVPRMLADKDGQMVNSQHAPHDVRWGEELIADVYEALRANEAVWQSSVLVIVYDEHGGFYDHVTPPAATSPDGKNSPTANDPSYAPSFQFDRLGLRVGAVVVSPWIAKGTIWHQKLQHTSVMKTARELFGVAGNLTSRDAEAASFAGLLSLTAPRTDAPAKLPRGPLPTLPATTDPSHPANQPLDPLQQGLLLGVHHLTRASHPQDAAELLPKTQGEASDYIKSRIHNHFAGPAVA